MRANEAATREEASAQRWARMDAATREIAAPLLAVDIDAFIANAHNLVARAAGKPIRVASKSVRSRHLIRTVLEIPGFSGILAFSLPEALWLAEEFTDILVAYPSLDREAFARLGASETLRERVCIMVDDIAHLDAVDAVLGSGHAEIRVAMDLDAAEDVPLLPRLGVWRSPIRHPEQVLALAREIAARPGFRLIGAMSYEAQIAGVGNAPPGRPVRGALVSAMQALVWPRVQERRRVLIAALSSEITPEFINGGGTGSLELSTADPSLTELAAGSGLYGPHLFDHYSRFRPLPAFGFAGEVVRRSAAGISTVLGGGWIASGPGAPDRLPIPVWPAGLRLVGSEGAGEVQTPLRGLPSLPHGSRVWFRPAKAGETCERVSELQLVSGTRVIGVVPTYRGEGKAFL